MKLTDIDLTDKTEIAAAIALLQAIAGDAVSAELAQDAAAVFGGQTYSNDPAMNAALRADAASLTAQGVNPMTGQSLASATPLPGASSAVAAAALPIAPAATPVSSTPLPGLPAPAHHITPAAAVPGGAAAAALTPPVSGVELDSTGLPWDERIHASTKTKTQKGVWTARRGVNDEAFIKSVEAELRATAQSAAPLPQTPLPGLTPLPGVASAATSSDQPPAIVSTGSPQNADPVTFEQLMPRVTQASIAGTIPATALQQACGLLGLASVVALQTSPEYVPHVWAQLKATYPALQ